MKNALIALAIIGCVAAGGLAIPARADTASSPKLLAEKPEKGEAFKGKVEAVDAEAKTLTVDGAAILIADSTKLTKSGKEIKLADIKVGDQVHGKTHKNADGKTEAIRVEVGGEKQ